MYPVCVSPHDPHQAPLAKPSLCLCAAQYRTSNKQIVVELQGDAVVVVATPYTQDYMVEHGVSLCLPDVPGITLAFTTLNTLGYVSGGGEIAWEISHSTHGADELEDYLLEAIYAKCGYWVPLSIIRLD